MSDVSGVSSEGPERNRRIISKTNAINSLSLYPFSVQSTPHAQAYIQGCRSNGHYTLPGYKLPCPMNGDLELVHPSPNYIGKWPYHDLGLFERGVTASHALSTEGVMTPSPSDSRKQNQTLPLPLAEVKVGSNPETSRRVVMRQMQYPRNLELTNNSYLTGPFDPRSCQPSYNAACYQDGPAFFPSYIASQMVIGSMPSHCPPLLNSSGVMSVHDAKGYETSYTNDNDREIEESQILTSHIEDWDKAKMETSPNRSSLITDDDHLSSTLTSVNSQETNEELAVRSPKQFYDRQSIYEEWKTRKNAKGRVNAAKMKEEIELIQKKSPSERTQNEISLLDKYEKRRSRKNVKAKERLLYEQSEIRRILAIRDADRTPEEEEFLKTKLYAKNKKRERDRKRCADMRRQKAMKRSGLETPSSSNLSGRTSRSSADFSTETENTMSNDHEYFDILMRPFHFSIDDTNLTNVTKTVMQKTNSFDGGDSHVTVPSASTRSPSAVKKKRSKHENYTSSYFCSSNVDKVNTVPNNTFTTQLTATNMFLPSHACGVNGNSIDSLSRVRRLLPHINTNLSLLEEDDFANEMSINHDDESFEKPMIDNEDEWFYDLKSSIDKEDDTFLPFDV